MTSKVTLTGVYVKEPDGYFSQTFTQKLVFGHRAKKQGKPTDFLILKPCCGIHILPDGSKERYVSGIFWKTDTTGSIDFEGIKYTLTITDNYLIIDNPKGGGKGL